MLLGPFLGHVTPHSIRIWLHLEGERQTIYPLCTKEKSMLLRLQLEY
jgi:hypothetical protein